MVALVVVVVLCDRGLEALSRAFARPRAAAAHLAGSPSPRRLPTPPGAVKVPLAGSEPSACLGFSPAAGSRGRTVFVDPGHGGPDPGTSGRTPSGTQVVEKEATLGVALELERLLVASGYRVVLARTQDTLVRRLDPQDFDNGSLTAGAVLRDLAARAACANAAQAQVLLSIHFNGFGDPSVGGTETFYDTARPFSAASARLARLLQAALVAKLGLPDRGTLPDDQLQAPTLSDTGGQYGHLVELGPAQPGFLDQPSAMPGALVEPLFLTDPEEARLVSTAGGRLAIAQALAGALESYLGSAPRQ